MIFQLLAVGLSNSLEVLHRLENNYKGTRITQGFTSDSEVCGLSQLSINTEMDISSDYLRAFDCVEEGRRTKDFAERQSAYDCASRIMVDIAKHSENSILASRVISSTEISGLSNDKLQALIEIEEEAQRPTQYCR